MLFTRFSFKFVEFANLSTGC